MREAIWAVLLELAPWLLLGAAVSGLLHAWLPEGFVHRQLRGRWGVVKAVLLGVPLPLCSCGVIPAGVGLKKDGASDGASVAFLISTPQTGVDSVLVAASFLGWPFALFKVGAAAVTGLAGGWLVEAVVGPGAAPVPTAASASGDQDPWWRRAWVHADDIVGSIWGWLVFGVVTSAALQTYLPADALAGTAIGGGVVASLFVLVLSLPLYVCATASVPIAAGLLHAGLPPGAALVFLMAGPATNVATVGAVYRTFGATVLGLYLGTVAAGSLGLGLAFDALLPAAGGALDAHAHTSWWAVVSALALVVLLIRYAWSDLRDRLAPKVDAAAPTVALDVAGMTCGGCARKVGEAVRGVEGVSAVDVQLEAGRVCVQGAVDLAALREAIRVAGFQPGDSEAL